MTSRQRAALVCSLVVLTMTSGWSEQVLRAQFAGRKPVASAGLNQTVDGIGTTVQLDGSGSSDPAGLTLNYHWTIVEAPIGSMATLIGAETATPAFVPDRKGRYRVQLVVDNGSRTSNPDVVVVAVRNTPPIADAGTDRAGAVGETVQLNGSASSDVDGDPLSFQWNLMSRPRGSRTTFADPTVAQPTFLVDKPGRYIARLVVNDGQARAVDSVFIDVPNTPPLANAGPDQAAAVGARVTLDGSGSTDVDGDRLRYTWSLMSRPDGSSTRLANRRSVRPSFVVDVAGQYVVTLTVNDGLVDSAPDLIVVSTGNSAPVANAGPDQTAIVTQVVHLDGSASTDVDGNQLTYVWTFVSRPASSAAVLSNATAINPTFVVDRSGAYQVGLVVNDGLASSLQDLVAITVENSAPVASAGADQRITVGATVTLNGSGSTDVDGDTLTYMWSLTSVPDGSMAALNDPAAVTPTFVADAAGTYVAQLIVSDGSILSAADTVSITTENSAPKANAGPDQSVVAGHLALLNGADSSDADGDALTFAWSFTSRPTGSAAILANPTSIGPSFIADRAGTYVVQLIVNDGVSSSVPDTVTLTTTNSTPVADAGSDRVDVSVGSPVTLDGTGSSDADGHPLTYQWSLLSRPIGSATVITGAATATPTFTPDLSGQYVAQLVVNDGFVDSPPDTVLIQTANRAPHADAGPDQSPSAGDAVNLDGSGSSDPDGQTITYHWAFASVPAGSTATLMGAETANPTFVADVVGVYVVDLTVTDSLGTSGTDSVTITAVPVVSIVATDANAAEAGADPGVFRVTRTGVTTAALVVSFTVGGSATSGADYTSIGTSVTIPTGQASATVTVTPINDALVEGPETVSVTLVDTATYNLGASTTATVTIADQPTPIVTVTATDPNAAEAGFDTGRYTFTRVGDTSLALIVTFTTGGTATGGVDYTPSNSSPGNITIPAGTTSLSRNVFPINDALAEGPETVIITLVDGAQYDLGASITATVTIVDNGTIPPPIVSVTALDPDASEVGPDPGTFRFTRVGNTTFAMTVRSTLSGTATLGADYTGFGFGGVVFVDVTFPAGSTTVDRVVTPIDDALVEGAETVIVTLINGTSIGANYDLGASTIATVTIADH